MPIEGNDTVDAFAEYSAAVRQIAKQNRHLIPANVAVHGLQFISAALEMSNERGESEAARKMLSTAIGLVANYMRLVTRDEH